jgi:tRNA A37 methylthiotransferase MiaB
MIPKVPERVAGERAALLARCADDGKAAYIARWIGKTMAVILEKDCNQEGDSSVYIGGTSENYLKASVSGISPGIKRAPWYT